MYGWLENALDWGISERDFWGMTLAELIRAMEGKKRQLRMKQQQRALFDYRLADLIGHSVARIYSKGAALPELSEAYPHVFDDDKLAEAKAERDAERFAAQLRAFAEAHNNKMNTEEVEQHGEQQAEGNHRG